MSRTDAATVPVTRPPGRPRDPEADPIIMRTLITGRPITPKLPLGIVTLVLDGIASEPDTRGR